MDSLYNFIKFQYFVVDKKFPIKKKKPFTLFIGRTSRDIFRFCLHKFLKFDWSIKKIPFSFLALKFQNIYVSILVSFFFNVFIHILRCKCKCVDFWMCTSVLLQPTILVYYIVHICIITYTEEDMYNTVCWTHTFIYKNME